MTHTCVIRAVKSILRRGARVLPSLGLLLQAPHARQCGEAPRIDLNDLRPPRSAMPYPHVVRGLPHRAPVEHLGVQEHRLGGTVVDGVPDGEGATGWTLILRHGSAPVKFPRNDWGTSGSSGPGLLPQGSPLREWFINLDSLNPVVSTIMNEELVRLKTHE